MDAKRIFEELCLCRDNEKPGGMAPNELFKHGVKSKELPVDKSKDEISNTEYYGDDGGKVVERYISYDHSRSYELRPDTNHFYISLYNEEGEMIDEKHCMFLDDH